MAGSKLLPSSLDGCGLQCRNIGGRVPASAPDQLVCRCLRDRPHDHFVQVDVMRQIQRIGDDVGHIRSNQGLVHALVDLVGCGPVTAEPRPPRYPAEELLSIVPPDLKSHFDPREVIARIVDDSDFDEWKPLYGTSLSTRSAMPVVRSGCRFRGLIRSPAPQRSRQERRPGSGRA